MAFSNLEQESGDVMSEINMVPLIDIMLVLLIIFIITVPVIKHAVNVELPQASTEPEKVEPQTISLSIDQDGLFYLDTRAVSDEELREHLAQQSEHDPQPALHISGDRNVRYERVAKAMALANETGLSKIGFVTEPDGSAGTVHAPTQSDGAAESPAAQPGDPGDGRPGLDERRLSPPPGPGGPARPRAPAGPETPAAQS